LLTLPSMLADTPFNTLTSQIIAAAIDVHRALGPGLLESTYSPCLKYELTTRRLRYITERLIPIVYRGMPLEGGYRVDLIVEDTIVVEIKSVERLLAVHQAQVLTYVGLTGCPAGLLINFNVPKLVDGVKRVINPHHSANSVST
jgi:GxxExxY protein